MTKKDYRSKAKTINKNRSFLYSKAASYQIEKTVINNAHFKNAQTVFIYVSSDSEPETRGIINTALSLGKTVCVPKCITDGIMIAVKINKLSDLSEGRYGLSEPESAENEIASEIIDTAIIPCVCASADLKRLGHGAGYYDRFLGKEHYKICLCFADLIEPTLPCDEYDVIMDEIITEKSVFIKQNS